jgi:pimeloyl-ACP methyl ester carboxylesterase
MISVIPRDVLNPAGHTWGAVAALGLGGANSWLSGKGPIYNLAFVHEEACEIAADTACDPAAIAAGTGWQDGESNLILAGKAPSSAAVGSIDFAKVAAGATELASGGTPGFHTFLYYSHLNLGEGLRQSTCIADIDPCSIYAGPYQPYAVEVRPSDGGQLPAAFFLHGVGANFLWHNEPLPDPGLGPAVEIFPFGRGGSPGYGGGDATDGTPTMSGAYGEQDVLDVYADAIRRLKLDANRVVMTGTSLGGLGALHISEFHPDLFTGVYSEVGGDCCIASTNHAQPRRLENLINLPLRMTNGTLDPLANVVDAFSDFYPAIDSLRDIDFLGFQLLRRTHDISESSAPADLVAGTYGTVAQCLIKQMLATRRVINPARVVYVVDPNFEFTDRSTGLEVVHSHAYWVGQLRPRSSEEARIDVTTLTRPVRSTTGTLIAGTGQNITSSGDLCGSDPAVQTDDAWAYQGIKLTPRASQPTSNGFTATITQFATASLSLLRMGISITKPITATIGGDGVTALTLLGPWRDGERVRITRDGVPDGTVTARSGAVVLDRDFAWQQQQVPGVGTANFSGVAPPAYLNTPAGSISGDQEQAGRVLGSHTFVLTPST